MIKRWQFQALMISIFLVCMALMLAIGVRAETNCKAHCQKQQKYQPKKTRYAAKRVQTIHIPTHIPESHRRAIMRMQPQYQRWAFTGFEAIAIYNFSYED